MGRFLDIARSASFADTMPLETHSASSNNERCISDDGATAKQGKEAKEDLHASARRLESMDVCVAVWDSGNMRIVVSESDALKAISEGGTVYSPDEMLHVCLDLTPEERKLLHSLKRLR